MELRSERLRQEQTASPGMLTQNRSELEFQRLLGRLPIAAYICNPDGLISYFNQSAATLWGRAPRLFDPVDRFCGSFRLLSADGRPIHHDECWMALALREQRDFSGQEVIIERPDGERKTALAYASPIRDESGKFLGAVNVLMDITERKRVETRLREADRAKDVFLATLAHELRNPLAPIRNAVGMLQRPGLAEDDSEWAIQVLDRQVKLMARLIDDLLDVSRMTRNRLILRTEIIELAEIIQGAVETSRPLIDARGHTLDVVVPSEPMHMEADPARLIQAVSNLLNNAAIYSNPGGRISLKVWRQDGLAAITIRDTGVGISAERLAELFEPFAQHDREAGAKSGLGVGLALTRRLVEMHGGSVDAASDGPGKGSEFAIRLPLNADSPAQVEPMNPSAPEGTSVASMRVLIADDNSDSADSLARLLKIAGNEVRTAADGVDTLGLAEEFRPEAVLMDIGMPRMNGYETARHIRTQPWGKSVVLIAITGWGEEADRRQSRDAGFDHHLVKPVDPTRLMELLAQPRSSTAHTDDRPR